ncbi:CPBP family intramembrane glutamic endopeptidase [Lishizhenia sp.]|uniref:CPBP family intramembrane glutamic endopeptidase n=1 Tax=Lishizhenia sp. TaxID=2497594 RepID=UPI00299D1195|nr:CPBP family intramembrane glutamic endopeptidase [Lishizhenia sp.]MDX1444678.1 CPBP family intramembrane glutamic endopeptidase [Lishizhenia sp.]
MQPKTQFYIFGLITFLIFPLPAVWALNFFEDFSIWEILAFHELENYFWVIGIIYGLFYALLVMAFSESGIMEDDPKQQRYLNALNLNWMDILCMSFFAGFGEEILFRAGIQHWLGPVLTSILFIAIHGYLNPKKWRIFIYGLFILPFILSLAFAYDRLGLWFCIGAHFAFDLAIFWAYGLKVKGEEKYKKLNT